MRILVCGGRAFSDIAAVYACLDRAHAKEAISLLITGGCTGADHIAGEWATERGVQYVIVPALWDRFGPHAGPLRNAAMLRELYPRGVIAFPGGNGTADMVKRAKEAGVPVWEPRV